MHNRTLNRQRWGRFIGSILLALVAVIITGDYVSSQSNVNCRTRDGFEKPICVVTGRLTTNQTFDPGSYWVLRGAVFVEEGATLTVDAGTEVFGEYATNGALIVARGGKLEANGTADEPVVFTSDQPVGQRGRGDWGGLIINGRAPLNVPGVCVDANYEESELVSYDSKSRADSQNLAAAVSTGGAAGFTRTLGGTLPRSSQIGCGRAVGEGDTGVYGGDDPNDDSGHLYYTRIEFAGTEFSPDNELNGIAFQGVGRGTEVDYVMVKANKDDGMEFFGGTVEVKHTICHLIADDSYDWTDGWTGKGQFMIALQSGDDADQGIEADNNADNNNLIPRSNPSLYNLTLIGDPDTDQGSESDTGILLREGTSATIRNFIVIGFKEASIDIDSEASFDQITNVTATPMTLGSGLIYGNCIVSGCERQFRPDSDDGKYGITTQEFVEGSPSVLTTLDPALADPFNLTNPDFRPTAGSPAISGAVMPSYADSSDSFFVDAPFIGAVGGPDSGQDLWWQGWTDFSVN